MQIAALDGPARKFAQFPAISSSLNFVRGIRTSIFSNRCPSRGRLGLGATALSRAASADKAQRRKERQTKNDKKAKS